ncbi:MAG: YfhO family protein [Nitrospinota bacterium]
MKENKFSFWNYLFPSFILLSLLTLYFFPVLFEGKTFFFRDIRHFAYPMKFYIAQTWAQGEWPFWYPNLFQGLPLMPLMHPGVFYPPTLFFLIKDFFFAFHAYFLFHHIVLMGSVFALCRFWGKSIGASLCASVTSLLGGYFLSLASVYNQFQTAVWFPLILMMWQKYLLKGQLKYFCGAGIFLALVVLGGGPENAIFSVLLIYAFSLCLAREWGFIQKSLAVFGLVGMALALSAVQWIPTYFFLQEGPRSGGLDFATSTQWSMTPGTLVDLVLPENLNRFMEADGGRMQYFIHSFYMGIVSVFILFSSLLYWKENKEIRFWLLVFLSGVFFALGKYNPLYSFFHEWVPIFDLFRFPEKFFFLCAFSMVFLLGLSLDRMIDGIQNNNPEIKKIALSLFITAGVLSAIYGSNFSREGWVSLMILLLLALSMVTLYLKKISRGKFIYFLLLLIAMDLMGKNSMVAPMIDREFYSEPPTLAKRLGGTADSFRVYSGALTEAKTPENITEQKESNRISSKHPKEFFNILVFHLLARDKLLPNVGTLYDMAYVNGKATLPIKSTYNWKKIFLSSDSQKKKMILKRSNVKYWVTEGFEQKPSEKNLEGKRKVEVFEDALPRAFLVGESITMPEDQQMEFYFDEKFDPLQQVLLTEPVAIKKTENFLGNVVDIQYPRNKVILKTRQNGEGFLVLMDNFFPGWEVRVDGVQQNIYQANSFYRAVKLGPGNHNVEFSYFPVGLKMGIYISVIAFLFTLFLFFKPTRASL